MMCCMNDDIKATTKIQADNFILLFFCQLLCVYAMRFIYMVVAKEIIFTCVIYAVTICGTNRKQPLAIRMDHYSVYKN